MQLINHSGPKPFTFPGVGSSIQPTGQVCCLEKQNLTSPCVPVDILGNQVGL